MDAWAKKRTRLEHRLNYERYRLDCHHLHGRRLVYIADLNCADRSRAKLNSWKFISTAVEWQKVLKFDG